MPIGIFEGILEGTFEEFIADFWKESPPKRLLKESMNEFHRRNLIRGIQEKP